MPRTSTPAEIEAAYKKEMGGVLAGIKKFKARLAQHSQATHNWGHVGDLKHFNELLSRLNAEEK